MTHIDIIGWTLIPTVLATENSPRKSVRVLGVVLALILAPILAVPAGLIMFGVLFYEAFRDC